jgi:hypothetical protein
MCVISDLVPKESVSRWLSYLRTEQPALAFKCPIKKKKEKRTRRRLPVASGIFPFVMHSYGHTCTLFALGAVITSPFSQSEPVVHRLTPHMCLGLDNLVELCKNYAATFDDSRTVTVGIVGWPGVGKSSLLIQLKTLQDRTLTAEEGEVSISFPTHGWPRPFPPSFLTLPPTRIRTSTSPPTCESWTMWVLWSLRLRCRPSSFLSGAAFRPTTSPTPSALVCVAGLAGHHLIPPFLTLV